MRIVLTVALLLGLSLAAPGAVKVEVVTYPAGEVTLQGYLAYDEAPVDQRPGVVVFPEWWGVNEYAQGRARQLAEKGYVALAADMYGNGQVATDPTEAGKLAGQFRADWTGGGRALMRERAAAALALLAQDPRVAAERLAAIGFCFGGTCALELAYSGAPLAAVVSFHGGLTVPDEADLPGMKASFLILHGADDPTIKPEQIAAFQEGLRQAGVDWEMIYYGGARHGFSNPANTGATGGSVAYQERAARRSWQAMENFFAEVLSMR